MKKNTAISMLLTTVLICSVLDPEKSEAKNITVKLSSAQISSLVGPYLNPVYITTPRPNKLEIKHCRYEGIRQDAQAIQASCRVRYRQYVDLPFGGKTKVADGSMRLRVLARPKVDVKNSALSMQVVEVQASSAKGMAHFPYLVDLAEDLVEKELMKPETQRRLAVDSNDVGMLKFLSNLGKCVERADVIFEASAVVFSLEFGDSCR